MKNEKTNASAHDVSAMTERAIPQKFAKLSYGSALAFLVLLTALHFIKPELDPSWRFISEYEIGNFGWMMSLAFLLLALSCISLSIALWPQIKNIAGRIGLFLLWVTATGMVIAAVFISDPLINTPGEALPTTNGKLHQLGALLDSIPFASVLISIGLLRKNELWKQAKKKLLWSTFFVWVGLIGFVVSMAVLFPANGRFGPDVLMGWPNRVMISVQCIWLVVVARQAIRINTVFNPSPARTKCYKKVIA